MRREKLYTEKSYKKGGVTHERQLYIRGITHRRELHTGGVTHWGEIHMERRYTRGGLYKGGSYTRKGDYRGVIPGGSYTLRENTYGGELHMGAYNGGKIHTVRNYIEEELSTGRGYLQGELTHGGSCI